MGGDRFGGVDGSLQVAGVNGIKFDITQAFCNRFCLKPARFGERHVEMTLGFIVDVALGFTMTN